MSRNRMPSWRPCLEILENRFCPAVDLHLVGSTLFIIGDSAHNTISVVNDGLGVLRVEADGLTQNYTESIDKVVVRTGAGDDAFFASELDFDFVGGISRDWLIDLGNGDDEAVVNTLGLLNAPTSITIWGGCGADSIFTGPTVSVTSTFLITILGGDGNDVIFNAPSGDVSGTMVATIFGSNGDDALHNIFSLFSVSGTFAGLADGGNGSDTVSAIMGEVFAIDPSLPPLLFGFDVTAGGHASYLLNGGNGADATFATLYGRIDGELAIVVDAGHGDDQIFAELNFHAGSTGQATACLRGGNGSDHLEIQVRFFEVQLVELPGFPGFFVEALAGFSETVAPLEKLNVIADGGNGLDTCLHSDWITLLRIENDVHS